VDPAPFVGLPIPALGAHIEGMSVRDLPRTPEASEDLLRKQEALLGFVESISAELELRPLLTRIIRYACDLLGADRGSIGLVDEAKGVIRVEAVHRMPPEEMGAEIPPGVGLAGQVYLTGEPVLLDRYQDLPLPLTHGFRDDGVLGVPIRTHGRLIGFFGIGIDGDRVGSGPRKRLPFTTADVDTLALFARHAGIAIEVARRYRAEQRRRERFELIARMGRIMTGPHGLQDMLHNAAHAIHELLGYPNVSIALLEETPVPLLRVAAVAGLWEDRIALGYPLPVEQGIMGEVAREGRLLLVNDVRRDPRYVPAPGAEGMTAELAVPLLLKERVLGVLNVESPDPFSEEDAASLRIVADQVAVAIENARLVERGREVAVLRERQRLARDLHDSVTQQLFGLTLIAQSLPAAWSRDSVEGERRTARVMELSRAALSEMRALLAELNAGTEGVGTAPRATDAEHGTFSGPVKRLGLAGAIRRYAAVVSEGDLEVEVSSGRYRPLPLDSEEVLYRVAREAIHNVVKHARARRAVVRLSTDSREARLVIRDDGDGLPREVKKAGVAPNPAPGGGMGLRSMREHVDSLGGTLRLEGGPGRGTTLRVSVPLLRRMR
jgi:signal transduction histidine kinase